MSMRKLKRRFARQGCWKRIQFSTTSSGSFSRASASLSSKELPKMAATKLTSRIPLLYSLLSTLLPFPLPFLPWYLSRFSQSLASRSICPPLVNCPLCDENTRYDECAEDYKNGALHPGDVKAAVAKAI